MAIGDVTDRLYAYATALLSALFDTFGASCPPSNNRKVLKRERARVSDDGKPYRKNDGCLSAYPSPNALLGVIAGDQAASKITTHDTLFWKSFFTPSGKQSCARYRFGYFLLVSWEAR